MSLCLAPQSSGGDLMCVCRLHVLNVDLTDARQRCEYFERDNVNLYAAIADLKASAPKAGDLEKCRRQLSAAEADIVQLQHELRRSEAEFHTRTEEVTVIAAENAQLSEINKHLQGELHRLQERSMSTRMYFIIISIPPIDPPTLHLASSEQ